MRKTESDLSLVQHCLNDVCLECFFPLQFFSFSESFCKTELAALTIQLQPTVYKTCFQLAVPLLALNLSDFYRHGLPLSHFLLHGGVFVQVPGQIVQGIEVTTIFSYLNAPLAKNVQMSPAAPFFRIPSVRLPV